MSVRLEIGNAKEDIVLYLGNDKDKEDGRLTIEIADFREMNSGASDGAKSVYFRLSRKRWGVISAVANNFFAERMG